MCRTSEPQMHTPTCQNQTSHHFPFTLEHGWVLSKYLLFWSCTAGWTHWSLLLSMDNKISFFSLFVSKVAANAFCREPDRVSVVVVAVTGTRLLSKEMAQGLLLSWERLRVPLEKWFGGLQEPQALDWAHLLPSLSALSTALNSSYETSELWHEKLPWSQVCVFALIVILLLGILAWGEKRLWPTETFSPLCTSHCSDGMSLCHLGVPLAHLLTGFMQCTN